LNVGLFEIPQAMVEAANAEGRKASPADFGDDVENAGFLNDLQKIVAKWVKEIQKVTKMERDPSTGSVGAPTS
jgi:dynein heavy chain 1